MRQKILLLIDLNWTQLMHEAKVLHNIAKSCCRLNFAYCRVEYFEVEIFYYSVVNERFTHIIQLDILLYLCEQSAYCTTYCFQSIHYEFKYTSTNYIHWGINLVKSSVSCCTPFFYRSPKYFVKYDEELFSIWQFLMFLF